MGNKTNCMDISSDKKAKSHTIKLGYGLEKKPLEKNYLFK